MEAKAKHLIKTLNLRAGATQDAINKMASILDVNLPKDYVDFLLLSNGGEGALGKSYIALWSVEDIPSLNEAYAVDEFAPGLLMFGSDGGGMGYAFNKRTGQIVEVPLVGMDLEEVRPIAHNFGDFFEYIAKQR